MSSINFSKKLLLFLCCLLSGGCAGPCVAPSPRATIVAAPVLLPLIALDPRSYHGKDGYSYLNAIPYLGVQKLKAIDRFERDYIVKKFKVAPDFMLSRERWGMDDKIIFRQINGRKRLLYFDTFPNEIAGRGIEPAKPGT